MTVRTMLAAAGTATTAAAASAGGKLVAGLGSSTEGSGIALIFDNLGKARIALMCDKPLGPCFVEVYDAATRPVASL